MADPAATTDALSPSPAATGPARPEWLRLSCAEPAAAERPAPALPAVPGFAVEGELGRGGMGVVYRATHVALGRAVALKVVLTGAHTSPRNRARFLAEARAAAQLQHPHIVQVFEVGDHDGLPYYALELLPGGTLAQRWRTPPEPREAAAVVATLARAVQAAHDAGIVHRDLKPANVLLAADGTPKITDFGLAKQLAAEDGPTRTGDVVGTPGYMAPEQALGHSKAAGPAADVYALGAILYEGLTGRPPFVGVVALDTLLQVLTAEPVAPSRLRAGLPRDLETIALKCLERGPGRRYPSAQALAEDLERFLADRPILARPAGKVERAWRWGRRNPAWAAAALAVLLGLVGTSVGLVLALGATDRAAAEAANAVAAAEREQQAAAAARREKGRAEAAAAEASTQARLANEVNAFLRQDLLGLTGVKAQMAGRLAGKTDLTARELLDRAARTLAAGERFRDQPLAEAAIRATVGAAYLDLGAPTEAVAHLERAVALYRAHRGAGHPETYVALTHLAEACLMDGRLEPALTLLEELRRLPPPPGADRFAAVSVLAGCYVTAGRYDQARELLEGILPEARKELGPNHNLTLNLLNNLAWALVAAGRAAPAIPLLEEAVRGLDALGGADHPDALAARVNLARAYHDAGQLPRAIRLLEDISGRMEAKLGPDHPQTLGALNNLAGAYQDAGQVARALPLREGAVDRLRTRLGPDHPYTLGAISNLAVTYNGLGRTDLAVPLLEEALAGQRAKLGSDHPHTLDTMNNLATGYYLQGRLDRALPLAEETLRRSRAALGPHHHHTLGTQASLGVMLRDVGRPAEAVPLLAEAHRLAGDQPRLDWIADELILACKLAGDRDRLVALVRAQVAAVRGQRPAGSAALAGELARHGSLLTEVGAFAEAEPLLRDCLAIREQVQPGAWTTANARSLLGGALLGQGKHAEARPLLIQGWEGLKAKERTIPPQGRANLPAALARLAQYYEATNQPLAASPFRAELGQRLAILVTGHPAWPLLWGWPRW